jgi:hypothetical protein
MRKTICASVLVLALCGSALGGDINNPPIVDPDNTRSLPSAPQTSDEQTADGQLGTGETATAADAVAAAALSVLDSMLALF